jgi:hypothetical protein
VVRVLFLFSKVHEHIIVWWYGAYITRAMHFPSRKKKKELGSFHTHLQHRRASVGRAPKPVMMMMAATAAGRFPLLMDIVCLAPNPQKKRGGEREFLHWRRVSLSFSFSSFFIVFQ